MARRSNQSDPELLRKKLSELIENFTNELKLNDLRGKVLKLVPAFHLLRDLGSSLITEEIPAAIDRVIFYLKKYPERIIKGDELMVVSGISDWPRRVRELRVQQGWAIISGVTAKEMAEAEESGDMEIEGRSLSKIKTDEYVLLNGERDKQAADRWFQANTIRKLKGVSVQDKILKYLRANVGSPVTGEELRYVANNRSEWARRVRELRTEEGWPVATRTSGWPELAIGTYVLEEDRQAPAHDRTIPDDVRVKVLERDQHSCQKCGWNHKQLNPSDPRRLLELHHKVHHAQGGENTEANLITLCNVHHDAIHAGKLSVEDFLIKQ
ncbi:5-methylcytosine-specific restriction endonuclease McrA [Collimonas sp. PA-H2]|uniref:HNH endonuclease n=1 Tax=Collimonas sp. PA-H2 TaxID=1881062 RepID=UPI000BF42855|nr:HNH endonuclease [Collimonas sp. PA-H2]PFH09726.1 5-methylcytosine-specific restriction endonuclease McrA [Collimonas sp. PA-H2]